MSDFSQYEAVIKRNSTVTIVVFAMLLLISCIGIFLIKKYAKDAETKDDRISDRIILVLAIACAIMSVVFIVNTAYATNYDIKNQAYIVYEGEFEIVRTKSGANVFLAPKNMFKWLEWANPYGEDGIHSGKIVYSEKTKIVFQLEFY
jgi:amino acid transporter